MTSPSQIDQAFELFATNIKEKKPIGAIFGQTQENYAEYESHAYTLYQRGKYDDAKTILKGIVALDHTRPYPHVMLGNIASDKGDFDSALGFFETAMHADPDHHTQGAIKYAETLLKLRDVSKAEQKISSLRESITPKHPKYAQLLHPRAHSISGEKITPLRHKERSPQRDLDES